MPVSTEKMSVPDPLKRNLDWYIANQKDLAEKYSGKVLLIVDASLVRVFDDMATAYAESSKAYAPDTFSLQECSSDSDSYTLILYSPVYATLK